MKVNVTKVVYNDEFCPFVLFREAFEWIRAKGYLRIDGKRLLFTLSLDREQ